MRTNLVNAIAFNCCREEVKREPELYSYQVSERCRKGVYHTRFSGCSGIPEP